MTYIRRFLPRAYIVGYTTREEAGHGLDISIDAPGITMTAFQFKAVTSGHGDTYRFRIGDRCWICSNPRVGSRRVPRNEISLILQQLGLPPGCLNQHTLLYVTSVVLESAGVPVYYAFPLIRSYNELESRILRILDYTILVRVRDMPIRTVLDCKFHTVEIALRNNNPNNATVTIHSEHTELPEGKYHTLSGLLEKIIEISKKAEDRKIKKEIHLDPETLRQLLETEFTEKARQEELEPELRNRAVTLAKAITKISFSYRGTLLITKKQ